MLSENPITHLADQNIMIIDIPPEHIATILESLEYSKQRIREAQGTPYEVRRENLARVEAAATLLRGVRNEQR
jgi:hypothetical protein